MPVQAPASINGRPADARWQGGSGRLYEALPENRDTFRMDQESLYILVEAGVAGWVGTARDLIDDEASRARFRRVMHRASTVLRLNCPTDDVERMCLVYDIDAGHQVMRRDAA